MPCKKECFNWPRNERNEEPDRRAESWSSALFPYANKTVVEAVSMTFKMKMVAKW